MATTPEQGNMEETMISRIISITLVFGFAMLNKMSYAQDWVEITPADAETPARTNSTAIYDPLDHRMTIFGGKGSSGDLNDVWSFDLNSERWSQITPSAGTAPAPRFAPVSVYDPERHQMIMWSGQGTAFFNDVWTFDLTDETWTEFDPPDPKPNIRYGAASISDPASRSLVTFAGFTNEGRFNDTWRFDVESVSWTDISPSEVSPLKRCLHSAGYDASGGRMIMYGGQSSGALGDIWAFDLSQENWSDLTPEESPEGRYFATNIYDAKNHRVITFGGNVGGNVGRSNKAWAFDLRANSWDELAASGSPPQPRDGATAIYVESEDRMVIFGGSAEGGVLLADIWSLNNLSQSGPTAVVDVDETLIPSEYVLYQNHPNPFNPTTTIGYELPKSTGAVLKIYDLLGQEVRTLVNETQTAGYRSVTWDGKDNLRQSVSSGVYVYRLETSEFVKTRKLLLIK